jgi:hypothetical protein
MLLTAIRRTATFQSRAKKSDLAEAEGERLGWVCKQPLSALKEKPLPACARRSCTHVLCNLSGGHGPQCAGSGGGGAGCNKKA